MFHNSAYLCPKVQFDVFPTYSSFAFCTFSFFWVWNWMVLDMFCVLLKRVLFSQEFGHGYLLLFLTLFCIHWLKWDHQWEWLHSRPVWNEKRLLSNTTIIWLISPDPQNFLESISSPSYGFVSKRKVFFQYGTKNFKYSHLSIIRPGLIIYNESEIGYVQYL